MMTFKELSDKASLKVDGWLVDGSYSSTGENSSLPTPQSGHTQSSGMSSKAVPGAMPPSGSPTAGSYTQPHTSHTYFFIMFLFLRLILR